jgi:hypothetical protein
MCSRAINGDFQYVPDLQEKVLNVRVGFNTGHLTKSLRNYFVNVRSPAEVAIPWLHLEVRNAATLAVPVRKSVLPRTPFSGNLYRISL